MALPWKMSLWRSGSSFNYFVISAFKSRTKNGFLARPSSLTVISFESMLLTRRVNCCLGLWKDYTNLATYLSGSIQIWSVL